MYKNSTKLFPDHPITNKSDEDQFITSRDSDVCESQKWLQNYHEKYNFNNFECKQISHI